MYYELTQEQYEAMPKENGCFSAYGLNVGGQWYIWADVARLPYYDWLMPYLENCPIVELPEVENEQLH